MLERKAHLDSLAIVLITGCCLLWGLNQVAAKVALAEVPALWQAAARSLGGALLVWGWARARRIPLWDRDGTLPGGLLAGALFGLEFACVFIGLQYTSASRMVVFVYTAPFVVALGMPHVSKVERLSKLQLAGLLIAFGGVASAFAEGFSRPAVGDRQWLGDALGLVGGTLWGATTLAVRASRLTAASAEKTLLYQLVVSGLGLAVAAAFAGPAWPATLSPLAWGSMAFQVVIVTFASFLLWFWLVRHYPATKLASFTLLTPVFGLVLGALLLGEPITARLVVALAAVACGIVLVNRRA